MIKHWYIKASAFAADAHKILAHHESAGKSRTIAIEQTYSELAALSARQDDLFRQALRCVENELFRAAHVMAWSAFIDYVEEKLGEDGYAKVRGIWNDSSIVSADDLQDKHADFQIIEGLRKVRLASKTEEKALKGLLNKRNECAHPSGYYPDLNDTLGYVTEILKRLETLRTRKLA